MNTPVRRCRSVWTVAALMTVGLLAAMPARAQPRDFLVGPVTLGPGDSLIVAAGNTNAGPNCRAGARVAFVAHDVGGPGGGPPTAPGVVVGNIVKTELGAAVLAPGQSASVQLRAGNRAATHTVQVSVDADRRALRTGPCINVGGTVVRSNGQVQAVSHAQFADDFSILRPSRESICVGSDDCDQLLELCEKSSGCSFTCHIAIPGEGQACVFGSTD